MGDEPAQPYGVHPHAVHRGPAGPLEGLRRRVRRHAASGVAASGRDQLGGPPGGAARRIRLARVVQLDDLDQLVEARGLRGEAHHQHRPDHNLLRCGNVNHIRRAELTRRRLLRQHQAARHNSGNQQQRS